MTVRNDGIKYAGKSGNNTWDKGKKIPSLRGENI
jgi:hypothetical protein